MTSELEEIQKLEGSREWQNFLDSTHTVTINGVPTQMTGQQMELVKKTAPEIWNIILDQNMQNIGPFLTGVGSVEDLPQTSLKYFINGSMGTVTKKTTDPKALENQANAAAKAIDAANGELEGLPRAVRNADKLSYSGAVAFIQAYDAWTPDQIKTAYAGKEAMMKPEAIKGAMGIAKGLNDRSDDNVFIQIDETGKIRVYRGILDYSKSPSGQGVAPGVTPTFEEVTGEGRFIPLGSYDAIEAGRVQDMSISVWNNMAKFGMSLEEARKEFNRAQIATSTAAQSFMNRLQAKEAGREVAFAPMQRPMSPSDIDRVEQEISGAKPTLSSKISSTLAPPEGIRWGDAFAESVGSYIYGPMSAYLSAQSEANSKAREQAAQEAIRRNREAEKGIPATIDDTAIKSLLARKYNILDPELILKKTKDGKVYASFINSEGKRSETFPAEDPRELYRQFLLSQEQFVGNTEAPDQVAP